jgi:gliding motility-associated protein GldE
MAHAPENWGGWIVAVAIALLCLLISAFVSGSEIAFFGLSQSDIDQLHDEDSANSKKICHLLDDSERLLATILISNNLVNVTMVILLTYAIGQTLEFGSTLAAFLSETVLLTFLLLLFGEVLPKLTARGRMLTWVRRAVPGIWTFYKLFRPISGMMVKSTSIVGKIVTKKQENISTEELSQALEISDVKEEKDKEMLEGILTFGEKQVSDIMISRVDITDIEYHTPWEEVITTVLESGYSRIPVYDTTQDTIRGILYSKDLLPYLERDKDDFTWQTLIRKAYFVPETRMLDDMLEDFRKHKIHIAVVVDEYGCTQGIVTLEDILEEIVGDINDEYDTEETRLYREIKPGVYRFRGKTPLVDFFRITDIDAESVPHAEEAETLAGLILAVKGDFPKEKETLEVAGCRITVLKMERHRIQTVLVKHNAPA